MNYTSLLLLTFTFFAMACSTPTIRTSNEAINSPPIPKLQKVFMIIFENSNYDETIVQPYFGKIAKEGAVLTHSWGVARPSQPNYIALTSGSIHGVKTNKNVNLNVQHLGDLLEAKGKTWRVYAEGYSGNCNKEEIIGKYVRKHVPFMSFTNVTNDPKRCAHIVSSKNLEPDIKSGNLADFSMYVPDLDNSAHDTSISFADSFFQNKFGPLLSNPKLIKDTTFIVTFDEGEPGLAGITSKRDLQSL
jgi:hypothetical protein